MPFFLRFFTLLSRWPARLLLLFLIDDFGVFEVGFLRHQEHQDEIEQNAGESRGEDG